MKKPSYSQRVDRRLLRRKAILYISIENCCHCEERSIPCSLSLGQTAGHPEFPVVAESRALEMAAGQEVGREKGAGGGTGEPGSVHDTWCMHRLAAVL